MVFWCFVTPVVVTGAWMIVLQVHSIAEMYDPEKRHVVHNVTTFGEFFWYFPRRIFSSQIIINSTRQHSLFYNVSLHGLEIPLQAFRIHLDCLQCASNVTGILFLSCFMITVKTVRSQLVLVTVSCTELPLCT